MERAVSTFGLAALLVLVPCVSVEPMPGSGADTEVGQIEDTGSSTTDRQADTPAVDSGDAGTTDMATDVTDEAVSPDVG